MPETLADPTVVRIQNWSETVAWTASASFDRDEVNPDTLIAMHGLIIGALEGAIEDDEAAADWATFGVRQARGAGVVVLSARVSAL